MADDPKPDPQPTPPASDPPADDPWTKLGNIVQEKVQSVFAGHVADHHTAPKPDDPKPKADPKPGPEGDPKPPASGDDRGFLAKAFGFK